MNKATVISTDMAGKLLTSMLGFKIEIDAHPSVISLEAPTKPRGRPPGKKAKPNGKKRKYTKKAAYWKA